MMRYIFLPVFFLVKLSSAFSQNGYSVTYQSVEDQVIPFTFNGEKKLLPRIVERLVFSDSFSIYYRILPNMKDALRKAKIFGEKPIHHAILYNPNTKLSYSENISKKGNKDFLIIGELKNENWQFFPETKEILGYHCRSALLVNDKSDSTLVWFTDSIPKPFGPRNFFGFSGLVLEIYQQPWNIHLRAAKIEAGNYQVVMPQKGIVISLDEYQKLNKHGKTGK